MTVQLEHKARMVNLHNHICDGVLRIVAHADEAGKGLQHRMKSSSGVIQCSLLMLAY